MSVIAEMRRAFDDIAPSWNNKESEWAIREKIIKLAKLEKGSVIADIGSGKGVMLPHLLANASSTVYAVDISDEMIKYAKQMHSDLRITFINDDVLNVDFPPLDAVMIFNAYPHLMDKVKLAEKLSKSVKVGGCVVIAHSAGKNVINGIHKSKRMERLSVPLRQANIEAREFMPQFYVEKIIDQEDLYFIKMVKK